MVSAAAPRTTTISSTAALRALSITCSSRVFPPRRSSCFGSPMRLDTPAARITAPIDSLTRGFTQTPRHDCKPGQAGSDQQQDSLRSWPENEAAGDRMLHVHRFENIRARAALSPDVNELRQFDPLFVP